MDKSTTVRKLVKGLSFAVALILVLLPFHAFLTVRLASGIGHYTLVRLWKEILLVLLIGGCLYALGLDKRLRGDFLSSRLNQMIILYGLLSLTWGIAGYALHKVTVKALLYGLTVNLRFLIFFLATWVIATKSQYLRDNWQKFIIWPAALVLLIGLLQRFLLPYDVLKHFGYNPNTIFPYETINHNTHYPRVMSTLRGANPLGAYLVLIISALTALYIKTREKLWGVLWLAAFVVLVLSYSRGAWVGTVVALAITVWASIKNHRLRRIISAVAAVLVVLAAALTFALRNNPTFQNVAFHTQDNSKVKVSSNQGHASALRSGVHDVLHEPLGRGVGTAGPASVYNDGKARISENYYIQLGQEVGWIGLALFLIINYFVAAQLWSRRPDTLALASFASFIGLVGVNMLSHAWTDDTLAYIWWGLAGLVLAAPKAAKSTKL